MSISRFLVIPVSEFYERPPPLVQFKGRLTGNHGWNDLIIDTENGRERFKKYIEDLYEKTL